MGHAEAFSPATPWQYAADMAQTSGPREPGRSFRSEAARLLRGNKHVDLVFLLESSESTDSDVVGDYACELSMMKVDGADRLFARAIQLAPSDARHRLNLGIHLRSTKRLLEAAAAFRAAVERAPLWSEARLQLGNALHATGDHAAARRELVVAVQEAPTNFYALHALAAVEFHLGAVTDAEEHLKRAIGIEPDYPLPYRTLADVVTAHGHSQEAARWNAEAMRRAPNAGNYKAASFVMSDDPRVAALPKGSKDSPGT